MFRIASGNQTWFVGTVRPSIDFIQLFWGFSGPRLFGTGGVLSPEVGNIGDISSGKRLHNELERIHHFQWEKSRFLNGHFPVRYVCLPEGTFVTSVIVLCPSRCHLCEEL